MGGKKGGEGMCTVQKDYMQGKKKGKGSNVKEHHGERDPLDGKVIVDYFMLSSIQVLWYFSTLKSVEFLSRFLTALERRF